jgi:hypothetical protein
MIVGVRGVVCCIVISVAGWPQAQQASPDTVPFPLGVAIPAIGLAFLRTPTRGLVQVDLGSGHVVHSWPVDGTPAGLYGNRLVAIRSGSRQDQLEILFLEMEDAEPRGKFAVAIPGVTNVRDPRFSYRAQLSATTLRLDWQVEPASSGIAPVRQHATQSPAEPMIGAMVVNLATSQPSALVQSREAGATSPVEQRSFPYQRLYPTWSTDPWRYGTIAAWLAEEPSGNGKSISLVTESGGLRSRLPLVTATDPFAFVTLDGSSVLVLASPPERAQSWVAFSVAKREKIGKVEFIPGVRELSVIGSRVYWLGAAPSGVGDALTVYAADLASGALMWQLNAGIAESTVRQTRRQ